MKNQIRIAVISALLITTSIQPIAAFADGAFSLTSGADYSTGKYGQSQSTDITYIPFIAKYETDDNIIKLTIPWLQITGPGDVIGSDAIVIRDGANRKRTTESGLGDIVLSATHTIANFGETRPLTLDLTGKIKFATASKTKRLGTGENDYILELDAYKPISDPATLFGGLGYKRIGDPDGINLNNVWFGSLGVSYRINPLNNVGIMADYRQSTLNTSEPLREVTAFFTHKFNAQYKLQSYITHGYSSASVAWGGGLMLGYTF